jgi:ubiquitin-protein ligase
MRRLRNDLAALERLRSDSSVFRFVAQGDLPQHYQILFQGKGLWRDRGKVRFHEAHRVEIKLGASYPRTLPEIRWLTPIYHPNISEIGMVCLGGFGTHWVPSIQLDELCVMLWDMLRYHNYDIRSPYNRDAALWVAGQTAILFPTDARPLRDLRAALGRIAPADTDGKPAAAPRPADQTSASLSSFNADLMMSIAQVHRRLVGRYRHRGRGRAVATESASALPNAPPVPSNSELAALVSAEVHTAVADGQGSAENGHEEPLVIIEPAPPALAEPGPYPSQADEIIFIE